MKNDIMRNSSVPHSVILEGRERLSISGVLDVLSFDENEIIMETSKGELAITGAELHVEKLSIESGDTVIEGNIEGIVYSDGRAQKVSLWAKLFQ